MSRLWVPLNRDHWAAAPSTPGQKVSEYVHDKACGVVRQAEVSFAPGQHSYTKRFARYVLELVRHMTMSDVAHHLGLSWDLVKRLLKEDLKRRFGRIRLKDLRLLAIYTTRSRLAAATAT